MCALKKTLSGSRILGAVVLLTVLGTSVDAAEEKSKVERSVEDTRESLQDLELMAKGISRDQSSGSAIDLNLSEGLQSSDRGNFPVSQGNLSKEEMSRTERKKEWAHRNWLLAGLQKQSESEEEGAEETDSGQGFSSTKDETEFWLEAAVNSQADGESEVDRERSLAEQEITRQSAINPLDDFLTQWIAPSELDRLNLAKSAESGITQFEPDLTKISGLPDRIDSGPSSLQGVSKTDITAVNPYLDDWEQSTGTNPLLDLSLSGREPVARSTAGSSTGVSALPIPSPRAQSTPATDASNKNNEAWKPPARTDEKYFPRLKRF